MGYAKFREKKHIWKSQGWDLYQIQCKFLFIFLEFLPWEKTDSICYKNRPLTPKAKKIFDPLSIDSEPTLILWSPNIFTFKFSSKLQLLKPKTSHLLLRSFSLLNVNFLVASLHIHAMYTTTNQNGDSVFRVKNINGLFYPSSIWIFFSIRIA